MSLDVDDPRPPYQQVASRLRAAILTKKLNPGDKLASGTQLAEQYGVARMTIQQAIRLLREDGLVVSRQGSGVYVRARTERPVGLRPHIEQAFAQSDVTIDFAGLSGETLAGALSEPLDQVRNGRLNPRSIALRALVPDPTSPWSLPCAADLSDDPAFRKRAGNILDRSLGGIADALNELGHLGLVDTVTAQIRVHGSAPSFKVYVLNGTDAFLGFYPVVPRTVQIDKQDHQVLDLMGKDATLFHHTATDDTDAIGTQHVEQLRQWFDSMWTTVGRDYTP